MNRVNIDIVLAIGIMIPFLILSFYFAYVSAFSN